MNNLTISKLGELVGMSSKTIRFYEEIKLIPAAQRAENGYRVYDSSMVEELQLIKYARNLGLPINQIRKLIQGCKDNKCEHTIEYIQSEINQYIGLLDEKITQMTLLKDKLQNLKSNLNIEDSCNGGKYCCNVLHQLSTLEKGGDSNG